jgi:hypothetical protein
VGRRLEAAWTSGPAAIASELAERFERGNEVARAIPHHQCVADKALRRNANEEAVDHLRRALNAIGHVTDEVERAKIEVELLIGLGSPSWRPADSERRKCAKLIPGRKRFVSFWVNVPISSRRFGANGCFGGGSEVSDAWRLCGRLLTLAEKSGDPGLKLQAHHAA